MKKFNSVIKCGFLWIIILCLSAFAPSCSAQDCENIPAQFTSYSQAETIINNSKFIYKDQIKTYKSSWIKSARYYSCDGSIGFLRINTEKGSSYLFQNVPIRTWKGFKSAESHGKFYNVHIRNKFQLEIVTL